LIVIEMFQLPPAGGDISRSMRNS